MESDSFLAAVIPSFDWSGTFFRQFLFAVEKKLRPPPAEGFFSAYYSFYTLILLKPPLIGTLKDADSR